MLRKSSIALCAIALSVLVLGTAAAQDNSWNQRTYFTFSAPIELPGKTLPAGTYLFRIADSPSNRHIVQVFDKDEKNILATLLAIPAQRLEASDQPEVRFLEVAANQPPAIRTWWFPGRTTGHEFIYPKDQAMRLARAGNTTVLTVATDANTTDTMREAELARINEAGANSGVTVTENQATGTAVSGRTTQTAVNTPPPRESAPVTVPQAPSVTTRRVDTTAQARRSELPHTATFLPLVGLFGLGSIAGAAALRLRRK